MYHPTRGGARGGAAEFSWETVKASKDREFYLGNSVAAPTGRWQDGRDINWYNKDAASTSQAGQAEEKRRAELRAIKQAEEEAMYAKLGRKPPPAANGETSLGQHLAAGSAAYVPDQSTGANMAPINSAKSRAWNAATDDITDEDRALARKLAKEQVKSDMKRRRREERELIREERRQRREGDGEDRRPRPGEHTNSSHHRRRHDDKPRSDHHSPRRYSRNRDEDRQERSSRAPEEHCDRLSHRRAQSRSRSRSRSRSPSRDHRREKHTRPRRRSHSPHRSHRHSSRREQSRPLIPS